MSMNSPNLQKSLEASCGPDKPHIVSIEVALGRRSRIVV
jgi:hypothetical protein